jgi:hypothetical protein
MVPCHQKHLNVRDGELLRECLEKLRVSGPHDTPAEIFMAFPPIKSIKEVCNKSLKNGSALFIAF